MLGNHDGKLLNDAKAMSYFEDVEKMMHVEDNGKQICLCHFPIVEWNGFYRGSWHIYGHIHNRQDDAYHVMKTKEHALNAGCMINNYTPASINELIRNNQAFRERGY